MSGRLDLPAKYVSETKNAVFDFTSDTASSETLSTPVCGCAVYSGTDASPSSVLSGSPSVSGKKVTQLITGGVVGVIYEISCQVTTSLGQILVQTAYLAIVPKLP